MITDNFLLIISKNPHFCTYNFDQTPKLLICKQKASMLLKSIWGFSDDYAWGLAFTFQTQEIQKEEYAAFFDRFVEFSEKKLKDAYNRMKIDTDSGLVYRKKQFEKDNELSAEYVIRDKRYYMKEICTLLEKCGFRIKEKRYVRAGHFSENLNVTDPHAKEILVIAEKK